MLKTYAFYNKQRAEHHGKDETSLDNDSTQISWNNTLRSDCVKNRVLNFNEDNCIKGLYRPFVQMNYYSDSYFIQAQYQMPKLFPTQKHDNLLICVTGLGSSKDFTTLLSNCIPDLQLLANGQCFPLYWYEEGQRDLFSGESGYIRHDGVSDWILQEAQARYGRKVNKEDIFYYVYAMLHNTTYRETFAADLKRMLPRLPLIEAEAFWKYVEAGRQLADLHLNYEPTSRDECIASSPKPYIGTQNKRNCGLVFFSDSIAADNISYRVQKMRFGKPTAEQKAAGEKYDRTTIIYNEQITLRNIPLEAYEYIVNSKSAIEWIMERYQVTQDSKSGIINDPNAWATEHNNPKYILQLLRNVIALSCETVEIVNNLPKITF